MAKRVSVVQNGTPSEEAEQQMQENAADEGREQYEQVTQELGPERLRLERKATNALEAAKVACNDLVRMILDPQGEMFPATDPGEVDD